MATALDEEKKKKGKVIKDAMEKPRIKIDPGAHAKETDSGNELIGYRDGKPLYASASDVYGDSAPTTETNPSFDSGQSGNRITPGNPVISARPIADVRADYQAKMNQDPRMAAGANRALEGAGVIKPDLTPVNGFKQTYAQGPASRPAQIFNKPRADGYKPASQQEIWDREDATATARRDGTMGDYWTSRAEQGGPNANFFKTQASAFPNRTTNDQADAQLEARDPMGGLGPKAIPVDELTKKPLWEDPFIRATQRKTKSKTVFGRRAKR